MSPRPSVEQQRREEVFDATLSLLAQRGYRHVRIADIAERTGLSTGIIHYYFKTKEQLLDATFRYVVTESRRQSEKALASGGDPWEQLVALVDAHLCRNGGRDEWVVWLQLWSEALVRPHLRRLSNEHYGRWIDLVEMVVRQGQEQGLFRAIDAREFVVSMLTMMDGLSIQHLMRSSEAEISRVRRLTVGYARDRLLGAP